MVEATLTKAEIANQAKKWGAEFVGFAPVDRWSKAQDVPTEAYPQSIWPQAKTVIVLGVPWWLPLVEASPTVLGREQSIVTNDLLEEAAYRLALFLNHNGYRSVNVSKTNSGGGGPEPQPFRNFSQVWAGQYAGIGRVGWNRTLLTPDYGPRVALASVFTALEAEGDPVIGEALCKKCLFCRKICPAHALTGDVNTEYAEFDATACRKNEARLQKAFCDPCNDCLKVCPVGNDRILFQSNDFKKYFEEQEILAQHPDAAAYRDWVHLRSYGSYPLEKTSEKP